MLKFYYNGIRENGGRLQRAFYSDAQLRGHPPGTITIYGRDYTPFSEGVRREFIVENNSDITTDYIEEDYIRVEPDHPLYPQVKAALEAMKKRKAEHAARFSARLQVQA